VPPPRAPARPDGARAWLAANAEILPAAAASMNTMDAQVELPDFLHKLCARAQAPERLARLPRPWVFTNGVFDVLHRGHVIYLAQARAQGASLVVAVNSDASARRLGKGPERPLNPQEDRAIMLAALGAVDLVTWFDEDTPEQLIEALRPDILVKGGDYDMRQLPETKRVESWGGRALALPFVAGYSTTALVEKIRNSG